MEADTDHHRTWVCPWTKRLEIKEVAESNYLIREATSEDAARHPSFWLRGLAGAGLFEVERPSEDEQASRATGSWRRGPEEEAVFATDGSGGRWPTDPVLARVGWGWCELHPGTLQVGKLAWGPLAGPCQTVPRAELQAIRDLVLQTSGCRQVYTDHENHVLAFAKGKEACLNEAAHSDLWADIFDKLGKEQKEGQLGQLVLRKVKAHSIEKGEVDQQVPLAAAVGNEVADWLAGRGARQGEVDQDQVRPVQELRAKQKAVLRRIVAVALAVRQHKASQEHREANSATKVEKEKKGKGAVGPQGPEEHQAPSGPGHPEQVAVQGLLGALAAEAWQRGLAELSLPGQRAARAGGPAPLAHTIGVR